MIDSVQTIDDTVLAVTVVMIIFGLARKATARERWRQCSGAATAVVFVVVVGRVDGGSIIMLSFPAKLTKLSFVTTKILSF